MLKLFASSGLAKLNFIKEYLDDLTESLDKYIVFAHHQVCLLAGKTLPSNFRKLNLVSTLIQKLLDALDSYFSTAGVSFIRIDGHTPQTSRQTLVDSFQNDGSVKVALLSITAASQGLTLTAASTVVFAELFWYCSIFIIFVMVYNINDWIAARTPALLLQAEDRVNRIGQKNACNIIYLLGQGTVDDLIWPMVERKLEVLSAVMDGNSKQLEYDTERRTRDDDKPSAAATSASTIATSAQASTMNPTQPNIMSYFGKPQPTTHTDKSSIAAKRPNVCPELHDLSDAELRMIGLLE
jgi:SWI/SNF-related matrix-associated actin-dependent regulator 1 of chromatin subfamily A